MELPVFDMASLDSGHAIPELHAACAGIGFFYVTGHGLDAALLDQTQHQVRQLFALPLEDRMAVSLGEVALPSRL